MYLIINRQYIPTELANDYTKRNSIQLLYMISPFVYVIALNTSYVDTILDEQKNQLAILTGLPAILMCKYVIKKLKTVLLVFCAKSCGPVPARCDEPLSPSSLPTFKCDKNSACNGSSI